MRSSWSQCSERTTKHNATMSESKKIAPTSASPKVQAFLEQLAKTPPPAPGKQRGRLLFSLDATASRQPTWNQAQRIQGSMFEAAETLGGLEIQLCYYRGLDDFRSSPWLTRADDLRRRMAEVECLSGYTQIGRVLAHALAEARLRRLDALVFVGDCLEEPADLLYRLAGELGLLGVRIFVFQEGRDPTAEPVFRRIAELTGGAHCRFDAGSALQLKELLAAVATYAAGGLKALENLGRERGGAALQLTRLVKKP